MSIETKKELLCALEKKLLLRAKSSLNVFCRSIEIPSVPIRLDDPSCEEFYPDTVEPAKHHQLINNILQAVADGVPIDDTGRIPKRVMLFMPPGSAKSTYATVVFPTWFMGRYTSKNIICTSYGSDLAAKFGRKSRAIARSSKFEEIMGCKLVEDNRAADDWSLTNNSTYMAGGILSGITGNRADILVIDDPIKGREAADSDTIREKTWEEYKSSLLTRLKPTGSQIIIQTRWHEDDLSGRILPKEYNGESGWIEGRDGAWWYVICLQAQCEHESDPLGRNIGEWLWTDWFTPDFWKQTKRTQGSRNWDALYQGKPKPSEGGIFKKAWFTKRRYRTIPANPIMIVQSWDTASKDKEFNDPSSCTTWAVTHDGWYLLDLLVDKLLYPDLKRAVKSNYKKWKPNVVLIEDKSSGQELISDLRADIERDVSIPIIAIEPEHSKELRAHAVSPLCEAGFVWFPESASWLLDFEREFFTFPLSKHKDQVDSVTQFLRWQHVRNVEFQAWGTNQSRVGYQHHDDVSQSHIDEDLGYGIVHGSNDYTGY